MDYGLITIFGAGLFTLVTPCIFPMLPVYLALLLGTSVESARTPRQRFRLLAAASFFVSGFSLVFTLLGLGASSLGSLLQEHRDLMLIAGGLLIALFGLKYLGVLRVGLLDRTMQIGQPVTASGASSSFLFGVVFGLGWTPCVGPILGSVLTYTAATAGGPLSGAGYLFAYSMGIGLPLIALSLAADRLLPRLRKLNRHLPRIEKATGIIMLCTGLALGGPPTARFLAETAKDPQVLVMKQRDAAAVAGSGTERVGASSGLPRVIKFFAESCPACRRMEPHFRQLEEDCVGKAVEVVFVDVGERRNSRLVREHDIRAVPTVVLQDGDGAVQGRFFGERGLADLRAAAATLLRSDCAGESGREISGREDLLLCKTAPGNDPSKPSEECELLEK